MASYRDKINQEKMETESGKIAFCIELMNRIHGLMPKQGESIDIFDNEDSDYALDWETFTWCVYKTDHYGDTYIKVLPRYSTYLTQVKVLEAQPWTQL